MAEDTVEENVAFWERVYTAAIVRGYSSTSARHVADNAVQHRREMIPEPITIRAHKIDHPTSTVWLSLDCHGDGTAWGIVELWDKEPEANVYDDGTIVFDHDSSAKNPNTADFDVLPKPGKCIKVETRTVELK